MTGTSDEEVRIVIAGGGFAALETMLALDHLAEGRARIDLVASHPRFTFRPMAVDESFGYEPFPEFDLTDIAGHAGAEFHQRRVVSVESDRLLLNLEPGPPLPFDYLVIATGATPVVKVPGALTFWPGWSHEAIGNVIDTAIRGEIRHLVFAIPDGPVWPLPAYELALRTAYRILEEEAECRVSLVTPESQVLEAFGPDVGTHVSALLSRWGVEILRGRSPEVFWEGSLGTSSGESISADQVVSIPGLEGPALAGLPHDSAGFLGCDEGGQIRGLENVFAAGDATSFPLKMGGIAMQQADAVADAIAHRAWGLPDPPPLVPAIQGVLLTDDDAIRLGEPTDGSSILRARRLWNPLVKASGRYLTPYLKDLYGLELASMAQPAGKPIEIDFR